jgi:hypothetical protein
LLIFAGLGLALESFHGFKVRAYLDVSNDTRRLMWTLAHAHGTLLSFVHIVFGLSIRVVPEMSAQDRPSISGCLIGASVLLPAGFFLGGVAFYGGDPGVGVLLVPIGAVSLIAAVFLLARQVGPSLGRSHPGSPRSGDGPARTATTKRRQ